MSIKNIHVACVIAENYILTGRAWGSSGSLKSCASTSKDEGEFPMFNTK